MIGGIGMEEAANNINSFMEYYNSGEWIKNNKSKYKELCERMRTFDFSRRTMSQCLTEDYCKGWNDCYEHIMKELSKLKST